MSLFQDPFREDSSLGCACGRHATQSEHDRASAEDFSQRALEAATLRALFPRDAERRGFIKAVGAGTLRGALASPSTSS